MSDKNRPFALCFVLLLAGCSKPAPPAVAHKGVGDLSVTLTAGSPPHIGDNTFSVTLVNSYTQAPIENAGITATPEMLSRSGAGSPSHGQPQGNGLYQVPIRLGVATRYDINLHIERPGSPAADVSFPVKASQ